MTTGRTGEVKTESRAARFAGKRRRKTSDGEICSPGHNEPARTAGDGDERTGVGALELRVQRIPCRNRARHHQHEAPLGGYGEHEQR